MPLVKDEDQETYSFKWWSCKTMYHLLVFVGSVISEVFVTLIIFMKIPKDVLGKLQGGINSSCTYFQAPCPSYVSLLKHKKGLNPT